MISRTAVYQEWLGNCLRLAVSWPISPVTITPKACSAVRVVAPWLNCQASRVKSLTATRRNPMITIEHDALESLDMIRLLGRLGAADSADVADQLISIFERGPGLLHIDMAGLEFIDSSGLSALVAVLKRARKQEGDLVLLNVTDRVRALLELTRLHEIFDIRDMGDDGMDDERAASGF